MNNYIVRQKDIEVLMQSDKTLFYKLELLNKDMKIIDYVDGVLISDSISISADSDVRRTYNCTMHVENSTFNLNRESKIWFDKMVRPYIGILHQRGEIVWYCLGTYLYTDLNYSYNATEKSLSITCLDMMCLLTDARNGQLPDYQRSILAGTDARTVIISLLEEAGITKYFIEFNLNGNSVSTFSIPYDLVYNVGTTIYTVIKEIVSLYPGTQIYFDVNGIFVINRIPTSKNEINILNDDILQPILINEQLNTSLSNVYNHIKIYGKINEPQYYTKEVTCTDGVYYASVVVSKLDEKTGEYVNVTYDNLDNFDTFCLLIPEVNQDNQYININNIGNILIVDDKGEPLKSGYLDKNTDCIFRYRKESGDFLYVGQYQCYGEAFLTKDNKNKNKYAVIDNKSDFSVEVIGDRLKVLSSGDYDKIPTNTLCNMRARKELYDATNMQDTLSLSVVAIPWLDVNMKVLFTSNITKQTSEYIITNISCDYSTYQMTINMSKFYPDYI